MLILYIWSASAFLHIKIKPLFREETETIRLFIFVIKLLRVNSRFRSWKATRKLSQWDTLMILSYVKYLERFNLNPPSKKQKIMSQKNLFLLNVCKFHGLITKHGYSVRTTTAATTYRAELNINMLPCLISNILISSCYIWRLTNLS